MGGPVGFMVITVALGMKMSAFIIAKIIEEIPLLAVVAFAPVSVPTCFQGSFAAMKHLMVGFIFANYQICESVIIFNPIYVMNNRFGGQEFTKDFLSYQGMLPNIAFLISPWMPEHFYHKISRAMFNNASFPNGTIRAFKIMPIMASHVFCRRISDMAQIVSGSFRYWCFLPAAALTKTIRDCILNVSHCRNLLSDLVVVRADAAVNAAARLVYLYPITL